MTGHQCGSLQNYPFEARLGWVPVARGAFSQRTMAADGSGANLETWARGDLVRRYANRDLRPVEVMILLRYREALSGRVLEVGCGAGRLSGYLSRVASSLQGIDISPAMVAYCRRTYPGAGFELGDMRDLGRYEEASFGALFAPLNVLDVLNDAERHRVLDGFRRVLASGGLLVMSSHNLAFAPLVRGPVGEVLAQARSRDLRGLALGLPRLPRQISNHRRLRRLEAVGADHATINDRALDFSLLHYYISPEGQERQLAAHGFELLECLDLDGARLEAGSERPDCSELHYVAACSSARRA